jgi:5-methylcytosine-specific restriction endonuclease McrA
VNRVYTGGQERDLRSSYAWTKKSKEIREKALYLCEVCKDRGVLTHKRLEVHHIIKIKDDVGAYLDNYNLICLCEQHHEDAEKGLLSQEYLRELVMKREKN